VSTCFRANVKLHHCAEDRKVTETITEESDKTITKITEFQNQFSVVFVLLLGYACNISIFKESAYKSITGTNFSKFQESAQVCIKNSPSRQSLKIQNAADNKVLGPRTEWNYSVFNHLCHS
jgi:hypothetical protein